MKKIKSFLLLSALCLILLPASSLFSQCLIADFPFNGNANDITGNGNNGTVTGGAMLTTGHDGTPNSAYFFDAVDDVITVSSSVGNFGTSDYTVSCWIKTTLNGLGGFITKMSTCAYSDFWQLRVNNGYLSITVQDYPGDVATATGTTPITDGNWHSIILIRTRTSFATWVDGKLEFTVNSLSVYNSDNNALLKIGDDICVGVAGVVKFTGSLDDVKLFNCALSLDDLAALIGAPCSVYDTVSVVDTNTVTIFDTTAIMVYDTIAVTDTLVIDVILSVSPLKESKIKVYPNPTHNLLIIDNSNYTQMTNYTLKIVDDLGQLIFTSPFNVPTITVDLHQFGSTGLYFLQVLNPSNQIVEEKKIVLH